MELTTLSALTLGKLIQKRECSAVEVTRAFLEKEDTCNAFITRDADAALARAAEVQARLDRGEVRSPLAGVPVAVKDNLCTRGMRTTCGSKMLASFVPMYNATVVERIHEADMILLGKTNMDEFAMGSTGETSYFGPVRHPYDASRSPGGSSSGSAAAVAGGLAPIALATDTGGSVRQPAAYCALTGLKPTYGAVSRYGLIAYASSLDTVGVLAHDSADAAALFTLIRGADGRDGTCLTRDASSREAKEYSIKELGDIPLMDYCVPAYYIIACAEASSNLARYDGLRYGHRAAADSLEELYVASRTEGFGTEVKKRIMLGNFVLSAGYYDAYYLKALKVKRMITDALLDALSDCDALLLPTVTGAAPRLGSGEDMLKVYQSDVYTALASLAGLPALTLPDGRQFIGKPFCEMDLIKAVKQYEV